MQRREVPQHPFAFGEQVDLDLAPIRAALAALDEPVVLAARHQRHDAVRLGLQAFGQLADGRELAARKALDVQQHQVLLRRDAFGLCRALGEALEAAHLEPELGQGLLELGFGQGRLGAAGHGSEVASGIAIMS